MNNLCTKCGCFPFCKQSFDREQCSNFLSRKVKHLAIDQDEKGVFHLAQHKEEKND